MRKTALLILLLLGCKPNPGELDTVVQGTAFDEAALVEKDRITILDFSADW